MGVNRADVIAYLRWLADQPDGVQHRQWLFHAALMLDRDVSASVRGRSLKQIIRAIRGDVATLRMSVAATETALQQERHGDQST